jgi:hypothetical protein
MERAVTSTPERIHWPAAAACLVLAWWTMHSGLAGRWIFLDFVNLAFHEAGHVFLGFAGSTVHYLGGTIGQLLVPGLLLVHFLRRERRPVGAAFCLWWLGQSLANVATYMADARDLALPLVGGGDHDWNELFHRFGVLDADSVARISGLTRGAGVVVMLGGLAWTGRLALGAKRSDAHADPC